MVHALDTSPASSGDAHSDERPRDLYRRFFEHSLQLLCVANPQGYFVELNPRWKEVLGYDLSTLMAAPFLTFVHPEDRDATAAEVERLAKRRGELARYETRFRTSTGDYRWLRWSARIDPTTQMVLASAQDITATRHSTERFRIAVEAAPAGMLIMNALGKIVLANAHLERTFGYEIGALEGVDLNTLVPVDARSIHSNGRCMAGQQPMSRRIRGLRKDGREIPIEIGLTRFDLDGEAFVLATLVDISEVLAQQAELEIAKEAAERSRAALEQEERAAAKLFDRITSANAHAPRCVQSYASPHSVFNGDTLLIDQLPSGHIRVLLGDFTGHGLTAAIGGLPLAETFRAMTRRSFSLREVLEEINRKLRTILPTGIFCAAIAFEIDPRADLLQVWNGGMHDLLLLNPGQDVVRLSASRLALGILPPDTFDASLTSVPFERGAHLFACTDGVVEARGEDGEYFGLDRVADIMRGLTPGQDLIEEIRHALDVFTTSSAQADDLTMVHVIGGDLLTPSAQMPRPEAVNRRPASTWKMHFDFDADALRHSDPPLIAMQAAQGCEEFTEQRTLLHLILRELYSNALEHGVLALDSKLKATPQGFADYYAQREQRLSTLVEGQIRLELSHVPDADGGLLTVEIHDSGPGFDVEAWRNAEPKARAAGRGIDLVRNACRAFEHFDGGRGVRATFAWSHRAKG